jgi:uncharacterized PurR-regulated membrane protein YhhQ (DUF165 family)
MLSVLFGTVARIAIGLGMGFFLSRTLPSMQNKVCRFIFLFVFCVPFNFIVNDVNVRLFGYHKMGLTGTSIIALFLATVGTFWPPQPDNSP